MITGADKAQPGVNASWKIPPRRTWLLFAIALLVNFLAVRLFMPGAEAPLTIPYTLFKVEVGKRNVQSIYSRGETLSGRFVAPVTFPPTSDAPHCPPTAGCWTMCRVSLKGKSPFSFALF